MFYSNLYSRRAFLKQSAGAAAGMVISGSTLQAEGAAKPPVVNYDLDTYFPRYTKYDPLVPVWNVTPKLDRCIHRFHLSSSFSPSGRYLGLTRFSREDRRPEPGEMGEIVIVDLFSGEQKIVAQTCGWDTQLGAQVQWGANDSELFFNDVDTQTWMPFGVKMDISTGSKKRLKGTIYSVSSDGQWAVSTCLRRIGHVQAGYGVVVPEAYVPKNHGAPDDDGVFVTNTTTGESRMVVSYKDIIEQARPKIDLRRYGNGDTFGFHTKFNTDGSRIMLVLRYLPEKGKGVSQVVTMTRDGKDICLAIPASQWADKGGNHPNWCPDGEHLMMNLNVYRDGWRFVQVRYDGMDLKPMTTVAANHGHPSLHPAGQYILTDGRPTDKEVPYSDGTAPLWLIDREKDEKKTIARVDSVTKYFIHAAKMKSGAMRVDFHPVWDRRTHTHVAFNVVQEGTRHVFMADLSKFVS